MHKVRLTQVPQPDVLVILADSLLWVHLDCLWSSPIGAWDTDRWWGAWSSCSQWDHRFDDQNRNLSTGWWGSKPKPSFRALCHHLPSPLGPALQLWFLLCLFFWCFSPGQRYLQSLYRLLHPQSSDQCFFLHHLGLFSVLHYCVCVCRLHSVLNPLNLVWDLPGSIHWKWQPTANKAPIVSLIVDKWAIKTKV